MNQAVFQQQHRGEEFHQRAGLPNDLYGVFGNGLMDWDNPAFCG